MQIEKILIVESPVYLNSLIESKSEIIDFADDSIKYRIIDFKSSVFFYLNGCRCNEEGYYNNMMKLYSDMQSEKICKHLITQIGCDRIEFK